MTGEREQISRKGHPAKDRIGDISSWWDRRKALKIIERGGAIQMIIGDRNAGVGGIFFNIDDPKAVQHVISIKSTAERVRQNLFAVMTPDEYFKKMVDLDLAQMERLLELAIFWRVPVKNIEFFPEHALTPGGICIQAFPSDRIPHFSKLVREAMRKGMRLGGTSLNYSGTGNITEIKDVKMFFTNSGDNNFWLNNRNVVLTGTSYTIVQVVNGEFSLVREGNVKFEDINK